MWRVRYLTHYDDFARWGSSKAFSRSNAFDWIRYAPKSALEIEIYFGPKLMLHYKRDKHGRLQRIWKAA